MTQEAGQVVPASLEAKIRVTRLHWTLLLLAALAFDLAVIILFDRTGHSRRVQWMSIGTGVILFVGVPTVILTLLLGHSFRARPQRRWSSVSLALALLASGAAALAYRYRLEHNHGETILHTISVFAILTGAYLTGSVINRRTSVSLMAFGSVSIFATSIAVIVAWSSNPCRYQRCADVGVDSSFGFWMSLAAALAIASVWVVYCAATQERRARWGLRFCALVVSMLLAAAGTLMQASHFEYGGFYCGPPILPYDAPPPPPSSTQAC